MSAVTETRLDFDPVARAADHWRRSGWGGAAEGMAAVTSITRAEQLLRGRVDAVLRPFDLTLARYEVLMVLRFSRTGQLPLGRMSERLQVSAGSITNAVDRLVEQGLVARRAHPTDQRSTLAELTPNGRAVTDEATAVLNDQVFEQVGLEGDDLRALVDSTAALRRAHGDFP